MTNQGLFGSAEKEEVRHSLCPVEEQNKLNESEGAKDDLPFGKQPQRVTSPRIREERRKAYEAPDLYECDRSLIGKRLQKISSMTNINN